MSSGQPYNVTPPPKKNTFSKLSKLHGKVTIKINVEIAKNLMKVVIFNSNIILLQENFYIHFCTYYGLSLFRGSIASNKEYFKFFPNQNLLNIPHHSSTPTKQT